MEGRFLPEDVALCPEAIPERVIKLAKKKAENDFCLLIDPDHPSRGYCYKCGAWVKAGRERNYKFRIGGDKCPACNNKVLCVRAGSAMTWDSSFIANIGTIQRGLDGQSVWVREWHVKRLSTRGWHGEEQLSEVARYGFRGKSIGKWLLEHRGKFFYNTYYDPLPDWQMQETYKAWVYDDFFFMAMPSRSEMKRITRGTSLQYMDLHDYVDYVTECAPEERNELNYMASFIRKRAFELLWKAGYKKLCLDKAGYYVIDGKKNECVYWGADSIVKALGLPRWAVRMCSPEGLDRQRLFQGKKALAFIESGRMSRAVFPRFVHPGYVDMHTISRLLELSPSLSVDKIFRYTDKQDSPIGIYRDYLEECKELRYNMQSKSTLFPKNLSKAHCRTMKLVEEKKDSELLRKFKLVIKRYEYMNWSQGDYIIRIAGSPAELRAEGSALHHCVGSYAKRVAAGETAIFFVRKADDPQKSFFTLELRDGRVMQCRTKGQRSYETIPEVYSFVQEWLGHISNVKKKKAAA